MKVLVCGGREYGEVPKGCHPDDRRYYHERAKKEAFRLAETLHRLFFWEGLTAVVHGGARGADSIAGYWAKRNFVEEIKCPANWKKHGRAAGMIRNQEMLDQHKPDLVVAAPGGRGTADMVRRAKAAGLEVIEIEPIN